MCQGVAWKTEREIEIGHEEKKAEEKMKIERRKNETLAYLKTIGGPFTCIEEVHDYIAQNLEEKIKQKRMLLEVQYARDSCRTLPKKSSCFRTMNTNVTPRRQFNSVEFAENLLKYFGKTKDRSDVSLLDFREALMIVAAGNDS